MSRLVVDRLQGNSATGNTITIPSGHQLLAPGHILQVVTSSVKPGTTTTTSATLTDTGLTATITPKLATSKILVLICHYECYVSAVTKAIRLSLVRNGNTLGDFGNATIGYTGTSPNYFNVNMQYFDVPGVTSALTYKTQFASTYGTGETVAVNSDGTTSYMTLMEIGG